MYNGRVPGIDEQIIPLFHTGHELPESPRIDFFIRGTREVSLIFFSNRNVLRVRPIHASGHQFQNECSS